MTLIPKLSLNVRFRLQMPSQLEDSFNLDHMNEEEADQALRMIQAVEEKEAVQEVNRAVNQWLYTSDAVLSLDA